MPETTVLILFIPTIFLVSISPGMCMTLAMTLGLYIGIKRTLWMMIGELLGVASVAVSSILAVSSLNQTLLNIVQWAGAAYLVYLGLRTWFASVGIDEMSDFNIQLSRLKLFSKGYLTAIANPKGWAFMIALLPPLIDSSRPLLLQVTVFIAIILISEFICMTLYATSGRLLRQFFLSGDNYKWINRVTGALLISVGIWLVAS